MPYVDRCKKCYGRGWRFDFRNHGSRRLKCDGCGGSGSVQPYREALTLYNRDKYGWRGVVIFDWPRRGEPGKCCVCSKPLRGRQKYYCSRTCSMRLFCRLYHGIHWQKRHVAVRDGCACRACGQVFEQPIMDGGPAYPRADMLILDHVLPLAEGGTEAPGNLQLLCQACNKTKTAADQRRILATETATAVTAVVLPRDLFDW